MTERLELRLTDEYHHKLSELVAEYRTSTSDVVRQAIDEAYDKLRQQRRVSALQRILTFEGVEDVPDPEELKRQIVAGYDFKDSSRH